MCQFQQKKIVYLEQIFSKEILLIENLKKRTSPWNSAFFNMTILIVLEKLCPKKVFPI